MALLTPLLIGSVLSLGALGLYVVGVIATLVHLRRRRYAHAVTSLPPVSLLKPLKGLEEQLEACLRSFFEQDYPGELELVFASAERDDPALAIARRVARDYPGGRARFVVSHESWGRNRR